MRKFFGTDGVRGKANVFPMTSDMALKLGQAVAKVFSKGKTITVVIGKDTRRSGYMLECALTAGLTSMGADVYLVGPMPTPAIAHLTKSFAADLGVVISASHNPSEDNGIKFFDKDGFKLPDSLEEEIESFLESDISTETITGMDVGKVSRIDDAAGRYIEFTKNSIKNMSLAGLKVVLDCANGAAYKVAPMIIKELGANLIILSNTPNGENINKDCGSQHLDALKNAVKENSADIGLALDGDADRLMVVDETGKVIDGDRLIAMCAIDMKARGKLNQNTVVVTVMSNIGFEIAMKKNGIKTVRTKVGDRYLVEELKKNDFMLGGEQSGHIIFFNRSTTGDGTLSALQILALMKKEHKKISELADCMTPYPQTLKNISVKEKRPIKQMSSVQRVIDEVISSLGQDGRVLVRYSGTEKKCRVMLEGKDQAQIEKYCDTIIDAISKEIGV